MRRIAALLLAAGAAVAVLLALAAHRPQPGQLAVETVGRGPQQTTIIRPAEPEGPLPIVLFLHGWGATLPSFYRPWLDHLARAGNAVIYPRYQESIITPPPETLGNILTGMRLALRGIDEQPDTLVVAGHSAGGALAADYAAIAATARLPVPVAVFSAYPGRVLEGQRFELPEIDPGLIPAGTRILALAGADDAVVGARAARRIVRGARMVPARLKRFVLVRDRRVSQHIAPQRSSGASRQAFWRRLDALIAEARAA